MKKLFFLIYFSFSATLIAQSNLEGPIAFMAESFGTSARMISIGQIKGFDYSSNAVFENPATLPFAKTLSLSAFQTNILDDVIYQNGAIAIKTLFGSFGFGYLEAGMTDIPITKEIITNDFRKFEKTGQTYPVKFKVSKISYGLSLTSKLKTGVSFSLFENRIENVVGKGSNVDLGIIYKNENIALSAGIQNILSNNLINYSNNSYENLPLNTNLGICLFLNNFKLYGQIKSDNRIDLFYSAGLMYSPPAISFISFSTGLKQIPDLNDKKINLNAGVILDFFGLNVSYSYEKTNHFEYDHNHYFSVGVNIWCIQKYSN